MTVSTVQTQKIYALAAQMGEQVFIGSGSSNIESQAAPKYNIQFKGHMLWRLFAGGPKVVSSPGLKAAYYQQLNSGQGGASGAGAGGSGAGGSGAPPRGATNALVRGPGTGQDINRGATNTLGIGSDVRSEFTGLNSNPPDTQIQPNEAAAALNVDSITTRGALSKRPGTVTSYPNRTVSAAAAVGALTVPAKANITNADYITITDRDNVITIIWFDTTGAETIPAAATAALLLGAPGSAGLETDISAGVTTAGQVAAAVHASINGAALGITSDDSAGDGSIVLTVDDTGTDGNKWTVTEDGAHAGFTATSPTGGVDGVTAAKQGRSINALPAGFRETSRKSPILIGFDEDANNQLGLGSSSSNTKIMLFRSVETIYAAQKDIRFVKPQVTITDTTAASIGFDVVMPARYRKAGVGNIISSVDKLVVLVSELGYQYDRDNEQDAMTASFLKEYTAWTGASVSVSDTGTAGTRRYYTVFALSKRYVSEVFKFYIDPT